MNERFEYFGEVKFILIILNSLCGQHMHLFVNKTWTETVSNAINIQSEFYCIVQVYMPNSYKTLWFPTGSPRSL